MSRLDDYRIALLAAYDAVAASELHNVLNARGEDFATFVIDHGLGPIWHERTGRDEFYESRMLAEALYLAQQSALRDVGAALDSAGIEHAVIKGAANRLVLYENPAERACYDLDILVAPDDRVTAARAIAGIGFSPVPEARNISRELVLTRTDADVDLHWGLVREGRLRNEITSGFLQRRRRVAGTWMLGSEDTLFALLIHPAFAKHLAGWGMGLHRVVDLIAWIESQDYDFAAVKAALEENGVKAAAWATLRWAQLLADDSASPRLQELLENLEPGWLRRSWLDYWLRNDLPDRTARARWRRLLGFSFFLHDSPRDAVRAAVGRRRAQRRSDADLAAFSESLG